MFVDAGFDEAITGVIFEVAQDIPRVKVKADLQKPALITHTPIEILYPAPARKVMLAAERWSEKQIRIKLPGATIRFPYSTSSVLPRARRSNYLN